VVLNLDLDRRTSGHILESMRTIAAHSIAEPRAIA
jgi:hypothetical protein